MRVTFSRRANADVREIWRYTAAHWGVDQAEKYLGLIGTAAKSIGIDPKIGRTCDDVRPGYRRYPVGSHVVFYRVHATTVLVVRILHQRMDIVRHL